MTAPVTKVAILFTGTALLFNSLRRARTIADSVHRDSAFVDNADKHGRFCAQGWFFVYYSARRTELLIMCTGTAFLPTSARDCIRCQ